MKNTLISGSDKRQGSARGRGNPWPWGGMMSRGRGRGSMNRGGCGGCGSFDQRLKYANGVRISKLIFPKAEIGTPYEFDYIWNGSTFSIFKGKSSDVQSSSERMWKGPLPAMDGMHEYDVAYVTEGDASGPYGITCVIRKVIKTKRIPLTRRMLALALARFDGMSEAEARACMGIPGDPDDDQKEMAVNVAIKAYGTEKWYQWLERSASYFAEWYIDELCPPYEAEALRALSKAGLSSVMRLACTEPWKLCFWWMTGEPLLEELRMSQVTEMVKRYGGEAPSRRQATADAAYHGQLFDEIRRMSGSYCTTKQLTEALGPDGAKECLASGLFTSVKEPLPTTENVDEEHIYPTGDVECEKRLASLLVEIATVDEDDCIMRPHCMRWPMGSFIDSRQGKEGDGERACLTEEQARALDAALSRRIHAINGKPGTGKTKYVLRAYRSAFKRGQVVFVTFTGMAARNLRSSVGAGTTAHSIINAWKNEGKPDVGPKKYAGRKVIVVEEASMMSLRLMLSVLLALGGSKTLRRILLVGDEEQMPPTNGGPSMLAALMRRYEGTNLASDLCMSMRITDRGSRLAGVLERICTCTLLEPGGFDWSFDLESDHPFVFVKRGSNAKEDVEIIRRTLEKSGIADPDSSMDWQVMVDTNEMRFAMAAEWFRTSKVRLLAREANIRYDDSTLFVGERVMFMKNCNKKYCPQDADEKAGHEKRPNGQKSSSSTTTTTPPNCGEKCKFVTSKIQNGAIGVILEIFDEDPQEPGIVAARHRHTKERKKNPLYRRWMRLGPRNLLVWLDRYGLKKIQRTPPVTVDKMQGQEVEVAIVLMRGRIDRLGRRGMNTACSRARSRCIVMTEITHGITPKSGVCPSPDFYGTIFRSDVDVRWKAEVELMKMERCPDDARQIKIEGRREDAEEDYCRALFGCHTTSNLSVSCDDPATMVESTTTATANHHTQSAKLGKVMKKTRANHQNTILHLRFPAFPKIDVATRGTAQDHVDGMDPSEYDRGIAKSDDSSDSSDAGSEPSSKKRKFR
jgi:hypothetical protein